MDPTAPKDFGVTHGLDFARWVTEITTLLRRSDVSDPNVQVAFLETAKALERIRRYKRDLVLGTFQQYLLVNEEVITQYPVADIVARPMVGLLGEAGLHSIGIDHRIDIANVEMLCRILADPAAERPTPARMRYVSLNPVKYVVVFASTTEKSEVPDVGMPTPADGAAVDPSNMFQEEADVVEALDDAFAGWSEEDDPLKAASRDMARKMEQVMPSLEKLAALDQKAPTDFLRNYFEKNFAELTRGKPAEEYLTALGHVLRALSPEIQTSIFSKTFKKADRAESVDALRCTTPEFRTNFLLERMAGATAVQALRDLANLVVAPGAEVQMVEHIAKRLLQSDLSPDDRGKFQRLLGVFGFDPSKAVRRKVVLYIGKPGTDYETANRVLTKRGYGVFLWDEASGDIGEDVEPDVAILDYADAGEPGLERMQKIAESTRKTLLIVFAAPAQDAGAFLELGAGRVAVLRKPVPADVLISYLDEKRTATRGSVVPGAVPRDNTSRIMKADLERAREIQERLIPREVPQVQGGDIAFLYRPCNEVGGDYLDLFWIAPGRLGFVIADVSGKGVAAAMVMVMVRSVFRSVAAGTTTPRDTLIQVNRMLARDVKKGIFVSALYGVYDTEAQRVTLVNGGHNPPVIWREATQTAEYMGIGGMALGLTERAAFDNSLQEVVVNLASGDKLLSYTDGVTEAFDASGDLYGEERLQEAMKKLGATRAQPMLQGVMADIDAFVGKAPRSDDTTMLVIGRPAVTLVDSI